MGSARAGSLTGAERDAVMEKVKQEIAVANVQELLSKMANKCFRKCISKPGTSLESSEQKCVAMCMDRYMDTLSIVANTYRNRLQREHERM
ncbi:mitochondrial import inner membrane translocase subunit Tim13-B isoform X1 [Belonocnema kinseyi]|uniref:mitochondrial import inner membrane translocase subunit Tim13-B isoform X1 n=1 Tax=Belonocnema kinseyi TaxID=2817044 RepID=UPI00143D3481|nr:mitochondrial import inner membrane translocase subunit Tim13-B isoform X1 [Belonocnema kinseyi]